MRRVLWAVRRFERQVGRLEQGLLTVWVVLTLGTLLAWLAHRVIG